jgi:acetyl esterase/lipase
MGDVECSARIRGGALALTFVACVLLAGCVGGSAQHVEPQWATPMTFGLDVATSAPVPVVVLVPGGGWTSADPSGLVPLAQWLAERGAVAGTVTYRTAADGAYFPEPVHDVGCAVAHVVAGVRAAGLEPGEVVIVGHSSGAQLAALVALGDTRFTAGCPDPAAPVDRLVGLAGPYDVVRAADVAANLFGPARAETAGWADGDPVTYAAQRPEMPVLLVHGNEDSTVPRDFTEDFAAALVVGGHPTATVYLDGVDHMSVFRADVAGPVIADWLGLAGP